MFTIDVIGSCICRDIFNSSFVSNYSEKFKLKTYIPRMSIPNIITKAEKYTFHEIKEKSEGPWQFECFFKMCEKNCLDAIVNNKSDLLLIDFYSDARYGVYFTDDNNYITANGILARKMYEDKKLLLMNYCNNTDLYFELWKKSLDHFMIIINKYFPEVKIVINGIKGTNKIRNNSEIVNNNISDDECKAINDMWKMMDEYAVNNYHMDIITFSNDYYLSPNYIYDGANNETVHFEMKYYKDAFVKLFDYAAGNVDKNRILKNKYLNLVKNNDFRYDFIFWNLKNAFFSIYNDYGRNWLKPVKAYSDIKSNYIWIWSNPIEINSDGNEEYTLSFDFIFHDNASRDTSSLFGIRTFEKSIFETFKEKLQSYTIPNNKDIFSEIGKIYHTCFKFKPTGKYIRVAPHVDNNCMNISFSNICLIKGANEVYRPWIDMGVIL